MWLLRQAYVSLGIPSPYGRLTVKPPLFQRASLARDSWAQGFAHVPHPGGNRANPFGKLVGLRPEVSEIAKQVCQLFLPYAFFVLCTTRVVIAILSGRLGGKAFLHGDASSMLLASPCIHSAYVDGRKDTHSSMQTGTHPLASCHLLSGVQRATPNPPAALLPTKTQKYLHLPPPKVPQNLFRE